MLKGEKYKTTFPNGLLVGRFEWCACVCVCVCKVNGAHRPITLRRRKKRRERSHHYPMWVIANWWAYAQYNTYKCKYLPSLTNRWWRWWCWWWWWCCLGPKMSAAGEQTGVGNCVHWCIRSSYVILYFVSVYICVCSSSSRALIILIMVAPMVDW